MTRPSEGQEEAPMAHAHTKTHTADAAGARDTSATHFYKRRIYLASCNTGTTFELISKIYLKPDMKEIAGMKEDMTSYLTPPTLF